MRYPTIALSSLAAINAFAIDVSTPVLPAAAAALNVDIGLMQLTIGLYMLGYAIGQIPIGLMGDYFGRRITVIISLIIFIGRVLWRRLHQAWNCCWQCGLCKGCPVPPARSYHAPLRVISQAVLAQAGCWGC